jgi:hypothetical protein
MLALMWRGPEREDESFDPVVWRLSQLHRCADVANFAPEPVDLERIVTHARKKTAHIPSVEEAMSEFAMDRGADILLRGLPPHYFCASA